MLTEEKRPKSWNQVIGQSRVLRVLHALLRNPQCMTRGFIFEGPWAVGKTSTAYLFARALMCMGDNPLGCGKCPSCEAADMSLERTGTLEEHPSVREVNAAVYTGVDRARELLDALDGQATLGGRSVVIMDEAHRLSEQAFDTFLKPLERGDTDVVFIFVTSKGEDIPETIDSRCASLSFGLVDKESLIGLLMSIADQKEVPYTTEGLRALVRFAHGRPRDAIKGLGIVAALGGATPENVETAMNQDAASWAVSILDRIASHESREAIRMADELAQRIGAPHVIEAVFTAYAQGFFTGGNTGSAPLREMTAFFLKWSATPYIPADALPLFITELSELWDGQHAPGTSAAKPTPPSLPLPAAPRSPRERYVSAQELMTILEQK